jgi:hypothetical protein
MYYLLAYLTPYQSQPYRIIITVIISITHLAHVIGAGPIDGQSLVVDMRLGDGTGPDPLLAHALIPAFAPPPHRTATQEKMQYRR